ncbi:fluoride efflux transporter CrcB [Singulisphaera sp. PoT]|uniref:fluoride efflux transporter CrcB n=1 Tax=Singulisphaera sp. PoT TaxID=3411797 RepID=UPI003BF5238F
MEAWYRVLVLSVGGALGVNARYWLGVGMSRWVGHSFPWATFTINVSGSFAIGFLTTILAIRLPHHYARLFLLVGFLGGYTTFSTFSLESLTLLEEGEWKRASSYLFGSVGSGLVAVAVGTLLARGLVDRPELAKTSSLAPAKSQPVGAVEHHGGLAEPPPFDIGVPEEA